MPWYNSMMIAILRSPMHGLLGKSTMLVTVTGRKSGNPYTTPVNFARDRNTLWVTSQPDRTWWRNLKGGAPMQVRLEGKDLPAHGLAITDQAGVTAGLRMIFQLAPQYARYFTVQLAPDSEPDPADLAKAAISRVIIRIDLEQ